MGIDYIFQVLTFSLFNNQIWKYLAFILILFIAYPISKIFIFILHNYLMKWATKTKFKLDDMLFKSLNPSITMFIYAIFFYFSKNYLTGTIRLILDKIFNFLIIIPIVYFMIKFSTEALSHYLKGEGKKIKNINEAAIDLLMQIIRIVLFLVGVLLILANMGYNVSALLAGLGVGGLAFALAAQDILKNFFAGIALIFDKTFGKNEIVEFQGKSGIIEELKLRSTKLRTYDGTLLTIPNAMLADNIVENITKVPRVKVKIRLGLTYDTSIKKIKEAKEIIYNIIKENPEADEKRSYIYFDEFNSYSLDIEVIYYAKKLTMADWPERIYMKEDINLKIKEEFEKAKIEMAFPTQTIELKK